MEYNNWCVKVTEQNKMFLLDYLGKCGFEWSIGAYYGKNSFGTTHGHRVSWGTIITFEEFQTKILNKSIEPNYEIY